MALDPYVYGIQGDDKSGKSSLALSWPKPLRHFDLDVGGFKRARNRYEAEVASGDIVSKSYYLPQQGVRQSMLGKNKLTFKEAAHVVGMKELWYEMVEDYLEALEDPSVATVAFDSFPQAWEICRQSYLQEKQESQLAKDPTIRTLRESLLQIEYSEPNTRMRAMIYGARQYGKNLVLTHQMAPVYGKVLQDGKLVDAVIGQKNSGWSHIGKEVDMMIQTSLKEVRVSGEKKSIPIAEIVLSGLGLDVLGMVLEDPSYGKLAQVVEMMRG